MAKYHIFSLLLKFNHTNFYNPYYILQFKNFSVEQSARKRLKTYTTLILLHCGPLKNACKKSHIFLNILTGTQHGFSLITTKNNHLTLLLFNLVIKNLFVLKTY